MISEHILEIKIVYEVKSIFFFIYLENGFELTKKRSRRYLQKTITDADDIAILVNAPAQAETLQDSLERTITSIGLHVNAH